MITKLTAWIKSKWLLTLISTATGYTLSFLLPLVPFLAIILVLVLCDLYTGIRAAKLRKEKLSSKGLRKSLRKIIDYFVAILLAEGMSKVFFAELPLTYFVACFIAVTEFISNLENISSSTGTDVLSSVLNKLKIWKKFGKNVQTKTEELKPDKTEDQEDVQTEEIIT